MAAPHNFITHHQPSIDQPIDNHRQSTLDRIAHVTPCTLHLDRLNNRCSQFGAYGFGFPRLNPSTPRFVPSQSCSLPLSSKSKKAECRISLACLECHLLFFTIALQKVWRRNVFLENLRSGKQGFWRNTMSVYFIGLYYIFLDFTRPYFLD